MPLNPNQVALAYQLILDRRGSEKEVANQAKNHETLSSVRRAFMGSDEFRRRYAVMLAEQDAQIKPALIHLHLPKTAGTSLAKALSAEPSLQPNRIVHDGTLDELKALPRPVRRNLRYIRGHLSMGAGEAYGLPYRYLCALRRPGPRIFSFYQFIKRTRTHPSYEILNEQDMSFGDYLDYSTRTPNHRLEIDNGQMRRLSGHFNAASFGTEASLLRLALHNITAPNMIMGVVEKIELLLETLVEEGFLASPNIGRANTSPNSDKYDSAISSLSTQQREIFERYIVWDNILYDTCEALIAPQTI
ncbi:hypothetical protein L0666_00085 [Octadecabacter sp. CECT 8868]|uniref:hypothetical protein n=1 Tax=Octadecabacter algicola TaxID=2909342 RepID=UPI001F3117EF|nr:hypothetical protein [Octadecabacter algicola]MCF2903371.1 hypothetical protein [Octadecabacter algicola]